MDVMEDVGAVMKELGAMVKGESSFDAATVSRRAGDLKAHAAGMPALFPEGSIHGPSEALPSIWEDFEGFSRIASDLESAATVLSSVTDATALSAALGAAGKTCKACHSDFRKP
jgi:cytochrome c556